LAITEEERKLCKRGLEECGEARVFRENLEAIEEVWREVDRRGYEVDWREFLRKGEKFVSFL
jgi:hypothetical protein